MSKPSSDRRRRAGFPIPGLLPGAVCGTLIGFFGFGPASYVYHSQHEGGVIRGREFFGYNWAAHTPFEHARDHAVGFGIVSGAVGAVGGFVIGHRARRPIGPRIPYLVAVGCLGFGLLHGITMSSRQPDRFLEGPVVSSLSAALAGYLGASLFRLWLNHELTDRSQVDDYG